MEIIDIIAILVTLSALFAYINLRYFKMPRTIGLMFISILASLTILALTKIGVFPGQFASQFVRRIDFHKALMEGMLGFLLFGGALRVDINDLIDNEWEIGIFSTFSVIFSTFIVGFLSYFLFGKTIPLLICLLFGALISPTDPVSVLHILNKTNSPKRLKVQISGESLFNDGVGVVIFISIFRLAFNGAEVNITNVVFLLFTEAIGGVIFGIAAGWIVYKLLDSVDNYQVEILLTIALVIGGYTLADHLQVSAPIAMVVAGLLIGNQGRRFAMSVSTRRHLDDFWELVDDILDSVLFVLIGLEILNVSLHKFNIRAGLIAIPVVLFARFMTIIIPLIVLKFRRKFDPYALKILTWGGLRGGISIAMALSLPVGPEREMIVTMTYAVVVFSILVQGLTINRFIKKGRYVQP